MYRCLDIFHIWWVFIWCTGNSSGNRSEIRIFAGNNSILSTFVAKFKFNFPGKEMLYYPGSEVVPFINTRPQDHLCIQDGGSGLQRLFGDSWVRNDPRPSGPWTKKYSQNTWLAWLAPWLAWLADLADPASYCEINKSPGTENGGTPWHRGGI